MINCNTPLVVKERIICSEICAVKFNDNPVAKFSFDNFVISDDSEYFDGVSASDRQVKWAIYSGGDLVYNFGFGDYFDSVPELSNGSIYSQLILGDGNTDILAFVESLPSTAVPAGTKLTIYIEVKDDTNIQSENISNKYCFTK